MKKQHYFVVAIAAAIIISAASTAQAYTFGDFWKFLTGAGSTTTTIKFTGSKECRELARNLKIGDSGDDVATLNDFLQKQGYSIDERNKNSFNEKTRLALNQFQVKFKGEILFPSGVATGTSVVGAATRSKINAILKCKHVDTKRPDEKKPEKPEANKITPEALETGRLGQNYNMKLVFHPMAASTGWTSWTVEQGALPSGLQIQAVGMNEASIVGSPTTPGQYTFMVKAVAPNGNYGSRSYTLKINDPGATSQDAGKGPMKVLTPNGGETWSLGTDQQITWRDNWCTGTYCAAVQPYYSISLLTMYGSVAGPSFVIDKNINSTGTYKWTVGAAVNASIPAGKYIVQICSTMGGCDQSDDVFNVVAAGYGNQAVPTNSPVCQNTTLVVVAGGLTNSYSYDANMRAQNYFNSNGIRIVSSDGSRFIIEPPTTQSLATWITRIQSDGIGSAQYYTSGCH